MTALEQIEITPQVKLRSDSSGPITNDDLNEIRPFRVNVAEAELTELRRRIKATKWPERETVTDASQGVQLATIQALASYWAAVYDWRKIEAKLNAVPQFITEIDGLDIHFIHVRSKHPHALKQDLHKRKISAKQNTNMKTQIKLTPGVALRRRVSTRAAVASLALVFAANSLLAGDKSGTAAKEDSNAIRPIHINVSKAALTDLRRRLAATRWPTKELVKDRSQGVQLATLKELVRYWATDYDWRKAEARLNRYPQFVTKIDGVDIHFIHIKSRHPNAMPMIMTHGWPGSVIELLDVIDPLTNPTVHGGRAEDAFDLVLPSLPGYGFSGEPTELGWENGRIAHAWAVLMERLGYTHYVAQGGDVGAAVTDAMGRQAPKGLIGIHLNLLAGALGIADKLPASSEQERAAHKALATFRASGFGYFLEQSTRPQTIGYSLLDSPAGLAAWLLDHDTDSYYKISRAFGGGKPIGNLTRENIVDNITLYWLTGTGASAARWYWEFGQFLAGAAGKAPPPVSVPVAFTTFPGEIFPAPRSWVETVYPGLAYFNEVDRGGHFAAWEEPELFASELRAAFKSLRDDKETALSR